MNVKATMLVTAGGFWSLIFFPGHNERGSTGQKEQVEGLTTAASILLSSAIGISVALRQLVLAVGVTLLALVACAASDSYGTV